MNSKIAVCFLFLFHFTSYPQINQNKNFSSDILGTATISVTIGGSFPITGTYRTGLPGHSYMVLQSCSESSFGIIGSRLTRLREIDLLRRVYCD